MNIDPQEINFSELDSSRFEELIFELIMRYGFSSVIWRKGGADDGRDIEASLIRQNDLLGKWEERWFFECKHYSKGVPPQELNSKIAWADAENPDHLVFVVSSYLTNNCRDWLDKRRKGKPYKIWVIEGSNLKNTLKNHEDLLARYFMISKGKYLLFEIKRRFLIYEILPDFSTINAILRYTNIDKLKERELVLILSSIYSKYSSFEVESERSNTQLDYFKANELSEHLFKLCEGNDYGEELVLEGFKPVELMTEEGCLHDEEEFDSTAPSRHDFIASEVILNYNAKNVNSYKGLYFLKKIKSESAIECLLIFDGKFSFKLNPIQKFDSFVYEKCLKLLEIDELWVDSTISRSYWFLRK